MPAKRGVNRSAIRTGIYHLATGISFYMAFIVGSITGSIAGAFSNPMVVVILFSVIFLIPGCFFIRSAAEKFSQAIE